MTGIMISHLVVKHVEVIPTPRPLEAIVTKPSSHRTVDDHRQRVHLRGFTGLQRTSEVKRRTGWRPRATGMRAAE